MSKVKIISSRSEDNIMGERKILSKIHHPFIVNMYFSFQDYDHLYLLMDLLSGGDLRYHLTHKKPCIFNEIQTKFFIANIILALEYLHSQKIIHRDIKPENLVLDLNGYVRLTDFGIAIINNKNETLTESSGTAGYMAPEVMLQQGHSYSADFFALGVIGYEFMIGNRPYYGKNRKQIKDFILAHQAKIKFNNMKKGWSENSKDFINRLLQRRPVKRLGYCGIKDIKNHPWLKDIHWDILKKKKIRAPYIPKEGKEFFDKKYCEEEKTEQKYKNIININSYQHAFDNYTFINLNYISKFSNENSNNSVSNKSNNIENELNSMRQMSFSESLIKGKSFCSFGNLTNKACIKINKNIFSTNKLKKSIKRDITNIKDNKNLSSSKDFFYNSTNQLNHRYYNIGLPKEKEISEIKEISKHKYNIKEKLGKKQLNRHCFSSDNLMREKKQINIKEIQRLIEKSILNSPMNKMNKVLSNNNNNTPKKENIFIINNKYSKSTKSMIKKPKTNRIMLNEQKSMNNEKEKEKDNLFNSTTKEKTTKEKTTENKEKNFIKKISKKITKNKDKEKNKDKNKVIKKEESKYSKNIDDNKNKTKDSIFQNQLFFNTNNDNKNHLIHSRNKNKLKKPFKSKTKENSRTNIKSHNDNNKETDYHIKVIHKKIYKIKNNQSNNNNKNQKNNNISHKYYTSQKLIKKINSLNKNLSIIKSHSINQNYMTINSISVQKSDFKSNKNIKKIKKLSNLKRHQKNSGKRHNKLFQSKGFNEFRKRKINHFKENQKYYKSLSNENILKRKKENKNDIEIKNNNINNNISNIINHNISNINNISKIINNQNISNINNNVSNINNNHDISNINNNISNINNQNISNINNIDNNNNNNDKIKNLKYDDYYRNTGHNKDSTKNNYYIIDKFMSL